MLTKTRSQIKNCKIAQTQWEDFSNKTFLLKGLAFICCLNFCVTYRIWKQSVISTLIQWIITLEYQEQQCCKNTSAALHELLLILTVDILD